MYRSTSILFLVCISFLFADAADASIKKSVYGLLADGGSGFGASFLHKAGSGNQNRARMSGGKTDQLAGGNDFLEVLFDDEATGTSRILDIEDGFVEGGVGNFHDYNVNNAADVRLDFIDGRLAFDSSGPANPYQVYDWLGGWVSYTLSIDGVQKDSGFLFFEQDFQSNNNGPPPNSGIWQGTGDDGELILWGNNYAYATNNETQAEVWDFLADLDFPGVNESGDNLEEVLAMYTRRKVKENGKAIGVDLKFDVEITTDPDRIIPEASSVAIWGVLSCLVGMVTCRRSFTE